MKILLAEDDFVTREMMKRILLRLADTVYEAGDGLEALEIVEREDPDFLFTDVDMPVIDGFELIKALRNSTRWSKMPVVCFSAIRERADVMRLLELGVVDYLLKPIRSQSVHDRMKTVIAQYSGWRRRPRSTGTTKQTLLLVDPDPNFRAFAASQLDNDYIIVESSSGADAARKYRDMDPKAEILLVAAKLPLLSETHLLSMIHKFASDVEVNPPTSVLMTDDAQAREVSPHPFTGVMRRTFVPSDFQGEIRRLLGADESPVEKLRSYLTDTRDEWFATGVRQTLGVMAGSECTILSAPPADAGGPVLIGKVGLTIDGMNGAIDVEISAGVDVARHLAAAVLRTDELTETESADVLSELINVIGGRVRASLEEHGWDLKLGLPEILKQVPSNQEWTRASWFSTSSEDTFHVGLRLSAQDGGTFVASNPAAVDAVAALLQSTATEDPVDAALF